MKLSAPIFILKQQAKALSRKEKIPLYRALNRIASREGYRSWSLLAAKADSGDPSSALLAQLRPGELLLIGARPGQGKTLLSLDLAVKTIQHGSRAAFFTLEWTRAQACERFKAVGADADSFADQLLIDDTDEICAQQIAARLASAPASMLVIVDYLQALDQARRKPDLEAQVRQLKDCAFERRLIVVCLSQIDRRYDPATRPCPCASDVRLPNPLDLGLFDRMCFLNQGRMRVASKA